MECVLPAYTLDGTLIHLGIGYLLSSILGYLPCTGYKEGYHNAEERLE